MKNIKTRPGVTLLGTATPYIELDVCTSRVLVATPDKLEQLLLQIKLISVFTFRVVFRYK